MSDINARPAQCEQSAAEKLRRVTVAVTGSSSTSFDEVMQCIDLLVELDTEIFCRMYSERGFELTPTTYERFCVLRDQRRAGEEAPAYSEKRAFEIAVLSLASAQEAAAPARLEGES